MRQLFLLSLLVSSFAIANDHNNIDGGRPLRFDDAYSIAFGERSLEFGMSMASLRRRAPFYGFVSEFKYGFAKNQDIGIGFDSLTSEFDMSYFHGVRREMGNGPALAYRADAGVAKGQVEGRLRGILTQRLHQYDKVHLNLDVFFQDRRIEFGGVIGYSMPLGYPRRFDRTLVAEIALIGGRGSVGLGLRHQLDARSVFDVGLHADRSSARLVLGFSVVF